MNTALLWHRTAIQLHHQAAMHHMALRIQASQSRQQRRQQQHYPGGVPIGMSPSTERNNEEMSRRKQEAQGNGGEVTFRWKNGLAGKNAVGPTTTTKKAVKVVWKKYGKRIVVKSEKMRSMPHHRCYYKCNYPGCSVKKTEDIVTSSKELTQTIFYGDHTHEVDPAVYYPNGRPDPERTTLVKPKESKSWEWEEYNPDAAAMATDH